MAARRRAVLLFTRDGEEKRAIIAFPPPAVLLWAGETYGRDLRAKGSFIVYRWVTSASASVEEEPAKEDLPRWHATITYRGETNYVPEEHDFEEIGELENLVEAGPDWNLIRKIEVRLNG